MNRYYIFKKIKRLFPLFDCRTISSVISMQSQLKIAIVTVITVRTVVAGQMNPVDNDLFLHVTTALAQQRSLLGAIDYDAEIITTRTEEGTKIFQGDSDHAHILNPGKEFKDIKKIHRFTDFARESINTSLVDAGGKLIGNSVSYVWNGSIGMFLDPNTSTARLEKARRLANAEDYPEAAMLMLFGESLENTLVEAKDNEQFVVNSSGVITVTFKMPNREIFASYDFDPAIGYLPRRSQLTNPDNTVMRQAELLDYTSQQSNGHTVFFPRHFITSIFIPQKVDGIVKSCKFLSLNIVVSNLKIQQPEASSIFEIVFPKKYNIYDEFSGHVLTDEDSTQLKGQIDEQVELIQRKLK